MILGVYLFIENTAENSSSEVMNLAVVNYDDEKEIEYFLNLFNSTSLSKRFNVSMVDEISAKDMLEKEEISSYIIIPKGFISSINTGENLSLTIVGNENNWVEVSVVKLAMNIAISYLTTAQAGIYATIDTAKELGATSNEINEILLPINISYGTSLLNFNKNYDEVIVNPTGENSLLDHYISSTLFFLLMISTSIFIVSIQEGTSKAILNRYRLCGIDTKKVLINKTLALFIIIFFYSLPLVFFFKIKFILVAFLIASIGILIANITSGSKGTGIISVLFISFFLLFISGGIIPIIFLPNIFTILSKLTPNYWIININNGILPVVIIFIYIIILNIISYKLMNRRLKL